MGVPFVHNPNAGLQYLVNSGNHRVGNPFGGGAVWVENIAVVPEDWAGFYVTSLVDKTGPLSVAIGDVGNETRIATVQPG
ncbi:hypothetical protein DL239_21535, partial [Sedimentitalea sp. CY04]